MFAQDCPSFKTESPGSLLPLQSQVTGTAGHSTLVQWAQAWGRKGKGVLTGIDKDDLGAPESEDTGADSAHGLSHPAAMPGTVPRQAWSLPLRGELFQPLV